MNAMVQLAMLISFNDFDMPPLSDLMRFPPEGVASAQWRIAERFGANTEKMAGIGPTMFPDRDVWLSHSRYCRDCWSDLVAAQCEEYDEDYRVERLRCLRHRLGDHCYYSGLMPPVAPIWLFREADPLPPLYRQRWSCPPTLLIWW